MTTYDHTLSVETIIRIRTSLMEIQRKTGLDERQTRRLRQLDAELGRRRIKL